MCPRLAQCAPVSLVEWHGKSWGGAGWGGQEQDEGGGGDPEEDIDGNDRITMMHHSHS